MFGIPDWVLVALIAVAVIVYVVRVPLRAESKEHQKLVEAARERVLECARRLKLTADCAKDTYGANVKVGEPLEIGRKIRLMVSVPASSSLDPDWILLARMSPDDVPELVIHKANSVHGWVVIDEESMREACDVFERAIGRHPSVPPEKYRSIQATRRWATPQLSS